MPIWLTSILSFAGKRVIHFTIYAIIAAALWGAYQKIFVSPTSSTHTVISSGGKIVNMYSSEDITNVPLFGCSAYRLKSEVYWRKLNPLPKK
jgi:hypothetical protein